MPIDMLDRLILDPGTRTIGELMQEREWAVWEIRRLRMDVGRLSRKKESSRMERESVAADGLGSRHLDPALNAQRLLRLTEVITMTGLGRSSIYRYVSEGRFPSPIKVGERSVRRKLADVLAWRAKVGE